MRIGGALLSDGLLSRIHSMARPLSPNTSRARTRIKDSISWARRRCETSEAREFSTRLAVWAEWYPGLHLRVPTPCSRMTKQGGPSFRFARRRRESQPLQLRQHQKPRQSKKRCGSRLSVRQPFARRRCTRLAKARRWLCQQPRGLSDDPIAPARDSFLAVFGSSGKTNPPGGAGIVRPQALIPLLLVHHVDQRPPVAETLDVLLDRPHHPGPILVRSPRDVRSDDRVVELP